MIGLCHKTFSADYGNAEHARRQAERFANDMGAEQIVSITEHGGVFTGLTVVVWYLTERDELKESLREKLAGER